MSDNVTSLETLKFVVSVWQIVINTVVVIVAVILTSYFTQKAMRKERKEVELAKKVSAIRSLVDEVDSIIALASKPWNSRMLSLPDDVWRSSRNEFYDMIPDTHSKLIAFYLEVNQINAIVNSDLHKVGYGHGYLDQAYQDQCIIVKNIGNELKPLLASHLSLLNQKISSKGMERLVKRFGKLITASFFLMGIGVIIVLLTPLFLLWNIDTDMPGALIFVIGAIICAVGFIIRRVKRR